MQRTRPSCIKSTLILHCPALSVHSRLSAVHGRTRRQGGGKRTGKWPANWGWIAAVKRALPIPVISNGNLRHHTDIAQCLEATGADGIMRCATRGCEGALVMHARCTRWLGSRRLAREGDLEGLRGWPSQKNWCHKLEADRVACLQRMRGPEAPLYLLPLPYWP